jgi:hypothetical protein
MSIVTGDTCREVASQVFTAARPMMRLRYKARLDRFISLPVEDPGIGVGERSHRKSKLFDRPFQHPSVFNLASREWRRRISM